MSVIPSQSGTGKSHNPIPERRKVNRACVECTRRKIRCDGSLPCKNCQWYSVENRCAYRQRNRRTNPTWKAIEDLSEAVQARNEILAQLLPAIDFDSFPRPAREQIETLLNFEHAYSSTTTAQQSEGDSTHLPEFDSSLVYLSDSEHEWNESGRQDYPSPMGDDVDGLKSQEKHGSYVGISSTSAALRLIFLACPTTKQYFAELNRSFPQCETQSAFAARAKGTQLEALTISEGSAPIVSEQVAVDAYFEHVHGTTAMIDEEGFRKSFKEQVRTDDAWVALLNMVLALGSIAAGDDSSHAFYYARAQRVIGFNAFGAGSLEMLQALILLGGSYLHYINSPNTAYLILGMAFRMAIAMALHRETGKGAQPKHQSFKDSPSSILGVRRLPRVEIRRRTWWGLLYADTAAGLSFGRPPTGTWDPATMDAALPNDQPPHDSPGRLLAADWDAHDVSGGLGTVLRFSAELAKLRSKLEYRLAQFSRMTAKEVLAIEVQLQAWERTCPQILKFGNACPKRIKISRDLLQYRYLATRIILCRPHLLRLIEDRTASSMFGSDDWRVVGICQEAAACTINAASANPGRHRIAAWHCSWYLFQACMVPLLLMTLSGGNQNPQHFSPNCVAAWIENLETALQTFKEIEPYKRASDRYGSVIESLYKGVMADGTLEKEERSLVGTGDSPEIGAANLDRHDMSPMDVFQDWLDTDFVFGDDEFNWQIFPEGHIPDLP